MTREELETLGLTKEQIDGTLDMYHKEHDPVQKELDTVKVGSCSRAGESKKPMWEPLKA